MGNLNLVVFRNPFNKVDKDIKVVPYNNRETLLDIRNQYFPKDLNVIVSLNGKIVPDNNLGTTYIRENDQIVFVPNIEGGGGGGGKNVFRAIAMIAVMAASIYIPPAADLTGVLGAAASAGIAIAGSLLINALLPPPKLSLPDKLGFEDSQTFSWTPQTTQKQGIAIPRIYGKNKVYGNIISTFIENSGDKQYLNVLFSLGMGRITNISDIKLNDQPIENYSDVQVDIRKGDLFQDSISEFSHETTVYPINKELKNGEPITYSIPDNDYDRIQVNTVFPAGVYYVDSDGDKNPYGTQITIESKKHSNTEWTTNYSVVRNLCKSHRYADNWGIAIDTHDYYDIKAKLDAKPTGANEVDTLYLESVTTFKWVDFTYPRLALVGIRALATNQLSGSFKFSCIADGLVLRVWNGDEYGWSVEEYCNNPAWVAWDILTQPVFDNDLNVLRYDGIDPSKLDLQKFKEWADYCDELVPDGNGGQEKRITFNGVFDSSTNMWDAVMKVCQVGRAILVWNGNSLTVTIDKPSNPVQLFSVGDIGIDSFKETFLPLSDRANQIEATFINQDNDYKKDTVSLIDPNTTELPNKTTIPLFGITKLSEVWRACQYRLNSNKYLTRTIEFTTDINSIASTVGDVILIQHDVPEWGEGGRLVDGTETTITLDKKVYIDINKSYMIMIKLSSGSIVERYINNPDESGDYSTFTVTSSFSEIPEKFNVYAFGEANKVTKPFRIIKISRTQEQKATITAIEYDERVYGDDTNTPSVIVPIDYSTKLIQPVENLQAMERAYLDSSGNLVRAIDIGFNIPTDCLYDKARIYIKEGDVDSWTFVAETSDTDYTINGVKPFTSYIILVQSIGKDGTMTLMENSPTVEILTSSNADYVSSYLDQTVTGLQIFNQGNSTEFTGKDCKFVWNDITLVSKNEVADNNPAGYTPPQNWFKDYEVTIKDLSGNIKRVEYVTSPTYTYTYEKNYADGGADRDFTIEVKARDLNFRVSKVPASLTVHNPAPDVPKNINIQAFLKFFDIWFDPVDVPDIVGYCIYGSQTSGFTPSDATLLAKIQDTHYRSKDIAPGNWYIKIAAYDTFGTDDLNYSDEYSVLVESEYVKTEDLIDKAVVSAKIDNAAISTNHLQDYCILNSKLADLAVDARALANSSVTSTKIANAAVGNAAIANLAVDSAKIQDGAITNAKIVDEAVGSSKIADAAIVSAKIGDAQVLTAKIADAAITNGKIADLAVNSAKIADATITTGKIADAQVSTLKIGNNAVTIPKIVGSSAAYKGTGSWITILEGTFDLPFQGNIMATTAVRQGYNSGAKTTHFILYINGTSVFDGGVSEAINDYVALCGGLLVDAGTVTVDVKWWGEDDTVEVDMRTLVIQGVMR